MPRGIARLSAAGLLTGCKKRKKRMRKKSLVHQEASMTKTSTYMTDFADWSDATSRATPHFHIELIQQFFSFFPRVSLGFLCVLPTAAANHFVQARGLLRSAASDENLVVR